jgi:heme-degrading monooxygenase HmoA
MATSIISARNKYATGINVFELPSARHRELLETLHAINLVILREKLPMIVASNFHVAIGSPVVINYNQYTDRRQGQVLRNVPDAAPLMKRTHDLSDRHEIRWYQVADVVTPTSTAGDGEIPISSTGDAVAAIGIFIAKPGTQAELLSLLKDRGETLRRANAPGFLGIATHRGEKPEHVASYERWQSADAYKNAGDLAATIQHITETSQLHLYEVVEVARFDLQQVADAPARAPG